MLSAEEFIKDFLAHADYDPAQRHLYYLKTRELKGRKTAAAPVAAPRRPGGSVAPGERRPGSGPIVGPKVPEKKPTGDKPLTPQQQQVEQLKARLATLKKVLAELVDQAQKRSGMAKTTDTPAQAEAKKSADKQPEKKLTPKQEADARKRAAEAYAKAKNKPISQVTKELKTQIADINAKIKAMRDKLSKTKAKDVPKKKPVPVGAGTKKK